MENQLLSSELLGEVSGGVPKVIEWVKRNKGVLRIAGEVYAGVVVVSMVACIFFHGMYETAKNDSNVEKASSWLANAAAIPTFCLPLLVLIAGEKLGKKISNKTEA